MGKLTYEQVEENKKASGDYPKALWDCFMSFAIRQLTINSGHIIDVPTMYWYSHRNNVSTTKSAQRIYATLFVCWEILLLW